jgi:alkylation response protein AidB-like acyl-CoA dehydrogenase
MDLHLNEEQSRLKYMVQESNEREVKPVADQIDRTQMLPEDFIGKMAQRGLFGMTIPIKYGGIDSDSLSIILACEELAYSGTGAWWLLAFNGSIPGCIYKFGTEKIRDHYLAPLCNGTAYASIQFTEEDTGPDPASLRTTALPDGNGEYYSISGMKRFSTFGARNGYAILFAKDETGRCTACSNEEPGGRRGGGVFA